MGTPLLMLLGASGGLLRGVLDAYNQVTAWRTARHEHRIEVDQADEADHAGRVDDPPRLRDYFDALPDVVAAVANAALGAITTGLLAGQGQIVGAYAAVAVGISAPALLTQLAQVQPIKVSVSGRAQETKSQPAPETKAIPEAIPEVVGK